MKNSNKQFKLVEGNFTASEVNNLIIQSLDNQINNCKIRSLSDWVHNHHCDQEPYRKEISQLEQRKQELQNLIKEAENAGKKINLKESLYISFQ